MKVLFSHGYFIEEDEKEQKIMKPYAPLGILYISAFLEKHGIRNDVHDTTFSNLKKTKNFILEYTPNIIALYTNLMTKLNVIDLIKFIRNDARLKNCIIILGGPDVRHNTLDYLQTGANLAVIGEGEQTMLEICENFNTNKIENKTKIDGIAYIDENNELITNKERKRYRPIDDLPYPNRKKIDFEPYLNTWKTYHGKSAMTVSTQRGCPYTCKWCSTAVYGQSYRRRSPKVVAQELKYLKDNYNPDSIWFVDDVFTVSHKWLEEFALEIEKQDAFVNFECITRADRMNEDVIDLLKKAGCFRVWIGAESGSQKIIDLMDRRVDVNQVRKMIQLSQKSGIKAGTFIMLGYPGETEDDIFETVNHLKESNPDEFTITIAYPIKGTSLFNEVEALQIEKLDWQNTTDRNRDFKRTYTRKYYDYAVRWVTNEVNFHKMYLNNNWLNYNSLKLKFKALVLRNVMRYYRLLS